MMKNILKFSRRFLILTAIISLAIPPPAIAIAEEWTSVLPQSETEAVEINVAQEKINKKIDLDYKEADLANVLRSLSWTYGLNIVTSPDIKGKVTISLKDIPISSALEAILTLNGLTYSVRNGIIYISPGDTKVVELTSEVIFLKYMKAADAMNLLRKSLSSNGDMKIDEVANSLIVTDYPANIEKVYKLLEKIDVPPRQVLVEAKIVDITSTDLKAMGVTWDYDLDPGHGILEESTDANESLDFGIAMAEQSTDLSGGQLLLTALTMKSYTITATIDALAKDGKANLLASPSIAVLNGQEARIIIGERYPYSERATTAAGITETTKFVDIGTTLRVTPQINDDGYITMRVHPEVSSLNQAIDAGPRITTREADTTVRIKAGETLVIGGLIKQQEDASREKIPILGDIPLIGYFFTRNEKDAEQKELAVFITPTILYSHEEKLSLAKEDAGKQDTSVNITKTAELNAVEQIYGKAKQLDKGEGLESWRKDKEFRMAQAVNLYENIYNQYPESIRAASSAYYAGEIYYKYYKNYKKARDAYAHIVTNYPDSTYYKRALSRLKKSERYVKAEAKRRARKIRKEQRRKKRRK